MAAALLIALIGGGLGAGLLFTREPVDPLSPPDPVRPRARDAVFRPSPAGLPASEPSPPVPAAEADPPRSGRIWVHGQVLDAEGRKVSVDACGARLPVEPDGRFSAELSEGCALRALRFGDGLRAYGPPVLARAPEGQDAVVRLELPDEAALEPYTVAEIQEARDMVDRVWDLCVETRSKQPPGLDCEKDIESFYRDLEHWDAGRRAHEGGEPVAGDEQVSG